MTASPLLRGAALGVQIGLSVVIPLVLFLLAGNLVDAFFGTSPLFLILGMLSSLLIALMLIWQTLRRFTEGP